LLIIIPNRHLLTIHSHLPILFVTHSNLAIIISSLSQCFSNCVLPKSAAPRNADESFCIFYVVVIILPTCFSNDVNYVTVTRSLILIPIGKLPTRHTKHACVWAFLTLNAPRRKIIEGSLFALFPRSLDRSRAEKVAENNQVGWIKEQTLLSSLLQQLVVGISLINMCRCQEVKYKPLIKNGRYWCVIG